MLNRRDLLHHMMLIGGYSLLPLAGRGWALAAPQSENRHLIVVMLRGAVDGLSIVAPYREPHYYDVRPGIALAPPGGEGALIDLDGFFGLHPSLAMLAPYWRQRSLAFVQACGSPSETRSHFEAQDILETALLRSATATQGWMNTLAQLLPDNGAPTRALSFGDTLPKIFQGRASIAAVPGGRSGGRQTGDGKSLQDYAALYSDHAELGALYKQGISARDAEMQGLRDEMQMANKGAPGADAFAAQSARAGEMIRRDPRIQIVFMDVGGWDTHVGQGNAKGQLAGRLEKLGLGLDALARNLGDRYRDSAILVMSEFGRTVAQNGNGGTDHGHGNVAWLMGGAVGGGKVYGAWPGLNPSQLWQGRDLAVTTDFRGLIGAVLAGQFGLGDDALGRVIAGYIPDNRLQGIVAG